MIYRLKPKPSDAKMGLMAYIFYALGLIEWAQGRVQVDLSEISYLVDPVFGPNPWDYWFRQPWPEAAQGDIQEGAFFDEVFGPSWKYGFCRGTKNWPASTWAIAREFMKCVQLKKIIIDTMNQFYMEKMAGKSILGVQRRGTDTWTHGHGMGQGIPLERYFAAVDAKQKHYEAILLVTDEFDALQAFRKRYPDKLIHFDDAVLSHDATAVHQLGRSGFSIGRDVIVEAELLALTDFMIIQSSNVSCYARCRRDVPHEYIDYDIHYYG